MLQLIKHLMHKDALNPCTLFNPFRYKKWWALSIWVVLFNNLKYELFWRLWWRDPQEELASVYRYTVKLEKRVEELKLEIQAQSKWTRL